MNIYYLYIFTYIIYIYKAIFLNKISLQKDENRMIQ